MRKSQAKKLPLAPDPRYNDTLVTRFVNNIMWSGKKSTSFNTFYNALEKVGKLSSHANKKARFRAVISLIIAGKETQFEGICEGRIISNPIGNEGFGYDPIFVPEGSNRTFAEMSLEEKNQFNHRTKAAAKLVAYLQTMNANPGI